MIGNLKKCAMVRHMVKKLTPKISINYKKLFGTSLFSLSHSLSLSLAEVKQTNSASINTNDVTEYSLELFFHQHI